MANPDSEGAFEERAEPGGTLLDINLTDVLQVLSVNRKTCTLFLRKEDEKGEIYLKEGKIIDAKVGDLKGEEALFYLLNWEGADFFIGTSVEGSIRVRIEKDLHTLILDWIEERDSRKRVKEVRPVAEEVVEEPLERDDDTLLFLERLEAAGIIRKAVK